MDASLNDWLTNDPEAVRRAVEAEQCRRSLATYIRQGWPVIEPATEYLHNWHIDAIGEYLEAVTAGQILRLLINMPPRYMKSIAVSVMWPTWEWTERPSTRWMFATYAGALSNDHSISRRTILQSDWYRDRWGHRFALTSDLIEEIRNDHRGIMTATSFGGSATGKGGNRVVVDDPHNPKKALSDAERATALREFDQTFSNRLNDKKRDAIVVVMQRLHEEDVSARCLELGYVHLCLPAEGEGRTVISLPSGRTIVREDGDLLWPEREGPAEIAAAKAAMGSYAYAGQYQQRPVPAGGGMFPRATLQIVDAAPTGGPVVRYWDKAGTQGGTGARSAGVKMTRGADGKFYVLDVVKGRWSAGEREQTIKQTAELDGRNVHVWVEQEPGSGGKESAENTVKNLAGWVIKAERVTGDKVTRAQPFAAQAEADNVRIVRGEWNAEFIDEASMFPNGKLKDQVDAASGAFNKLALAPQSSRSIVGGQRDTTKYVAR